MLLHVTTVHYRLLEVTTGYYRILQVTTGLTWFRKRVMRETSATLLMITGNLINQQLAGFIACFRSNNGPNKRVVFKLEAYSS